MTITQSLRRWNESFKWRDKVLFGAVGFSAASLAIILYNVFVSSPVLDTRGEPLRIIGRVEIAGRTEAIVYRLNYCKENNETAIIHRELRREMPVKVIVPLALNSLTLPAGCDVLSIVEIIPPQVPMGRYALQLTLIAYRVGSISHPVILESDFFDVKR
jgi:hypothetical protein